MRDFRKELFEVFPFHCTFKGGLDDKHNCIFDLIYDMLNEIEDLREYKSYCIRKQ